MNRANFIIAFRNFQDRKLRMLEAKGCDYAADADEFSNFKAVGALTGLSPQQIMLVMIGIKLMRLANLLGNGKTPANEPVSDSAIDQANYVELMAAFADSIPLSPHIIDSCARLSIDADALTLLLDDRKEPIRR